MTALAAPSVQTTLRGSGVAMQQARRIVDMSNEMWAYDPTASPFLVILSSRAGGKRAANSEFKHLEDQPLPKWDTLAEDMDTTETGMDVAHGSYFVASHLLYIPTSGEYMKVTSISTNTLTVTRDIVNANGGTGYAASNGAYVKILGTVNDEGGSSPSIRSTQEAVVTNYCQIVKNPFGATNTLDSQDLYTGKDKPTQTTKYAVDHAFDLESIFLWGKKAEYTNGTSGQKERTTGGIYSWIATNSTTVTGGSLTDLVLETWAETMFRYSRGAKLILASRRFMTQLDMIAAGRLQVMPREDTYGVEITRFVSSHGTMMIAPDDALVNDFAGYAIGVDMSRIQKRFTVDRHGARDARLEEDLQATDADQWKSQYLSEVGCHVYQEACHSVLKGLT